MNEETEKLSALRSEIMGALEEIKLLTSKIVEEEILVNCQIMGEITHSIASRASKLNEQIGKILEFEQK